jgi:4-amino-4-deoxy-L-arabinose transferase-like glycosyltransferase
LILAALLRLLQLGSESLWWDEALTVAIVRLDWGSFSWVLSHKEANMGLYYCLLRLWINLGESEFVLRSLSALTGVLGVSLVYVLGKRLFDTKVGLMGAALLATNSFHIQYSQEARGYSLMVLLTALSSLFFLRAIEQSSRNEWAGYILTATLAVYTHFFSVLVLGAHWVWLVLVRRRNIPWRGFLVAVLAIGMLLVPLAIFALARGTGPISWIAKTRPQDAYNLFNSLVGGGKLLLLAYLVPCSIAFLCTLKAWVQWKELSKTWSYAFLLSWLFVPLVAGIVISVWKPVLVDRYFIICLPPLVLLAVAGLSQVRPSWISGVGLIVLLSLSARADFRYYSHPHKDDWRGATAYVVSHALPKDGILFYRGSGRFGFDYYVRRLNPEAQTWQIVFPEPYDWTKMGGEAMRQPSDSLVRTIPKGYERVWLVLRHENWNPMPQIHTTLQANFPQTREQEFRGVKVVLYQQK